MVRQWCVTLSLVAFVLAGQTSNANAASAGTAPRLRVLPVVPCPTLFGANQPERWHPVKLTAVVSKTEAAQLAFYSNGFFSVLGPRGWACQGTNGADGSNNFIVYPVAQGLRDDGPLSGASQDVYAVSDYTGHGPGSMLVCPYFPGSIASHFFDSSPVAIECPTLPSGTRVTHPTTDIADFEAPHNRTGQVLYPQTLGASAGGVDVELESCRITGKLASLCSVILQDFNVRAFPSVSAFG